jgi:hypothetical protein
LLALVSSLTLGYVFSSQPSARFFTGSMALALSAFWLISAGCQYQPAFKPGLPREIAEYSDMERLASEIRSHIGPSDCIYIFSDDEGSSNLYYLLNCPPPHYWVFHYPWYMIEPIKSRALMALETSPPQWVVYFPNRWQAEQRAPEIMDYINSHYQRVTSLSTGQILMRRQEP